MRIVFVSLCLVDSCPVDSCRVDSSLFGRPVGALVAGRLAATARLASVALLFWYVLRIFMSVGRND